MRGIVRAARKDDKQRGPPPQFNTPVASLNVLVCYFTAVNKMFERYIILKYKLPTPSQ